MGRRLVRQPDGLWAVWSSVVDAIILFDCDEEGLVDYFANEAAEAAAGSTRRWIARVRNEREFCPGESMTWDDAITQHERRHGPLREA